MIKDLRRKREQLRSRCIYYTLLSMKETNSNIINFWSRKIKSLKDEIKSIDEEISRMEKL